MCLKIAAVSESPPADSHPLPLTAAFPGTSVVEMSSEPIEYDEWEGLSTEERLTRLLVLNLDACLEIIETPINSRDDAMLSAKVTIVRAVITVCVKFGVQLQRPRRRAQASVRKIARDVE
jgi:hypothetical protein